MSDTPPGRVTSLYVHVPFCLRKCDYCAFYSEAAGKELRSRYVRALLIELERNAPRLEPATVFFGGGTPSLLSLKEWEAVFEALERLGLAGAQEFTVESNPATINAEQARMLRAHGVNRVSMGVQSFDEKLLERLGRVHTRQEVFDSFSILRQSGYENINLDLMFGIPGQSMKNWEDTLAEALAFQSEHLSSYEIIYEEDTAFFLQLKAGKLAPDEDLSCAMYDTLLDRTSAAGFRQYEVANFAKGSVQSGSPRRDFVPSYACRHNVNYWKGGEFIGLGPSATSYVGGVRTRKVADTKAYCDAIESGGEAVDFREQLSPLARAGEIAAFGLRMTSGWSYAEFQQVTGHDLREEWAAEVRQLMANGWSEPDQARLKLNAKGLRFADSAAQLFLR